MVAQWPLGRIGKHHRPHALHEPLVLPSLVASGLKSSQSLPSIGSSGPRLSLPEVSRAAVRGQLFTNSSTPDLHHARPSVQRRVGIRRSGLPKQDLTIMPAVNVKGIEAGKSKFLDPRTQNTSNPKSLEAGKSQFLDLTIDTTSHPKSTNRRPSLLEVSQLVELEEDAHASNLSGAIALAFALVAKCGSIENAWMRFDVNKSRKMSRWQWESGLSLLHIDTKRVCGVSEQALFAELAVDSEVTLDAWSAFFKPLLEDPESSNMLKEALKRFEEHKDSHDTRRNRFGARRMQVEKTVAKDLPGLADAVEREAKLSAKELEELELQAAAESSQLQEELRSFDLEGDEALAYILTAKFGSLQKAFRWFNSNGSGRLSHNEWDTGVRVMRLDIEKLTGSDIKSFFRKISGDGALIRQRDWTTFFRGVMENSSSAFKDILQQAAGSDQSSSLAERAKSKKKELIDARTKKGLNDGADDSSGNASKKRNFKRGEGPGCKDDSLNLQRDRRAAIRDSLGELSEAELSFRERVLAELSQLAFDNSAEYSSEDIPDLNERKVLIIEDVAVELGLYPHAFNAGRDDSKPKDCMIVFNLGGFPQQALETLRAIPLHNNHEFPPSLSTVQRQLVHHLAASIGLWTRSEGKGESRRIVAFNVGDFAKEVREQLKLLRPGESKIYSPKLSEPQRRLVKMIASELHLTAHSEGIGEERHVEVFNLAAFENEVRSELQQLGSGVHKTFAKTLTREERKIVHCVSDELDLAHTSEGAGADRAVTVANLRDFRKWVRNELEKLEPGQTRVFEASLSVVQRKTVHELATDLGMSSMSQGVGSDRFISVIRSFDGSCDSVDGPRAGTHGRSKKDADAESDAEETDNTDNGEDEFGRVFQQYASGSLKDEKLYTRLDLDVFCEVLEEVTPHRRTSKKRLKIDLESVYEDVLQLQIDFGCRTKKGLSLRWFHVFIQKVASKVGFSAMGLLVSFLDES